MKGLAIFTVPAATAASLLILAMSNAAGKFAMDRNEEQIYSHISSFHIFHSFTGKDCFLWRRFGIDRWFSEIEEYESKRCSGSKKSFEYIKT